MPNWTPPTDAQIRTVSERVARDLEFMRWAEGFEELKNLVMIADRMFVENASKIQAKSDAKYQAEFGHDGPKIASPLDSAGREYVYWRHRLNKTIGLPSAMEALKYGS